MTLLGGLAARVGTVLFVAVQPANDSPGYFAAAHRFLASGFSPTWLFTEYRGRSPLYIAFLALTLGPSAGWLAGPILAQALLAGGVPAILYLALRLAGGSALAAWMAWGLALASYELTRWNLYFLTDSLFVTLSALVLCAALLAPGGRPAWAWAVGVGTVLALLVRPTGLAVAGAALLAGLAWRPVARPLVAAVLAAVMVYAAYLGWSPVSLEDRRMFPSGLCTYLVSGRVVWGGDAYRGAPIGDLAAASPSPAACVWRAVTQYPGRVVMVMARKAAVYWIPVYPNYSVRHRAANLVLLGGPILLALVALVRRPTTIRGEPRLLVPLAWIAAFTVFHAVTWVEGDHRFLAPALPAVYLLAGEGVARVASARRPGGEWARAKPPAGSAA